MSWWRDHGGTVVMVVALWAVFNDPIDRLLPVPMPELEPGPRTTWLAEVPFSDGRPDYAAAIDADDAERLTAGADGYKALQGIMAEQVAGVALTAYLLGLELGPAGKGTADSRLLVHLLGGKVGDFRPLDAAQIGRWQERCGGALDTLLLVPASTALAVPTVNPEPTHEAGLARSRRSLLTLFHLAAAGEFRGQTAITAGDPDLALIQVGHLVRLSAFTAGLDDVPGLSAAHAMRRAGWQLALSAIAARPRDPGLRRIATDLLDGAPVLPGAKRAMATLRLLSLRQAIGIDQAFRDGKGSRAVRDNRPPDVNEALRLLNDWYDAIDRALPETLDTPGLARVGSELPLPAEFMELGAPSTRPLANRMLFAEPVAERRRQAARMVALVCSSTAWMSLQSLFAHATKELQERQVLTAVLAVPMGSDAEAFARDLRQQLGLGVKTDESLLVQVDGSAVLVTPAPKAKPPGADDSTPAKPPRPPLVRIDLASPP